MFDLFLKLFKLVLTVGSKELELLQLTRLVSAKSQKCDMANYFADSNTGSFVSSIAPFEEDWCPSQGQQEALLAEVALVVDGSVAGEVVVGVDIASVSPSAFRAFL